MKPLLEALAVSALSVLLPAAALAQEYAPGAPPPQGPGGLMGAHGVWLEPSVTR